MGGRWGAGSVSLPPSLVCPPPTYRESPLAALLHCAGPPPPHPSLPEKGQPGGGPHHPPGPGALGGPLPHRGAVLGVLGWLRQPGELQLQDTCGEKPRLSVTHGCSSSLVGVPCRLWVSPTLLGDTRQGNGVSPRKSSAENLSLSHTWRMSLGGTFSTVSSRLQKCSCHGGEGEREGCHPRPLCPPHPCTPHPGVSLTFLGRTQSCSAAKYSKEKTKRQLKPPSPCSER